MGSASREALAQARAALPALLSVQAGSEVLAAASQFAANPALAAALGDAAAPAAQKQQVVERLFGAATADARKVITAAVSARWSNVTEFIDGVEELGLRGLGRSSADLAQELLAVADVVDREHELQLSLGSKLADPAGKVALVEKLFGEKLSAAALATVKHLVASPRGRRLDVALRNTARVVADEAGMELVTVTVAAPLAAAQTERLAQLLASEVGRQVKITTIVDPTVIGGVHIAYGDTVIDGSVRARLEDLRQQLAA